MEQPVFPETKALEEAFFRKRDAELLAAIRRKDSQQNRKRALAEVSGIKDESVLEQLVEHDIHAETLAAFSLVPIIEVAWADGKIQIEEGTILTKALADAGISKDGMASRLVKQWIDERPHPNLMKLWQSYTRALTRELTPDAVDLLKKTVVQHARAVAEAAGGFLGFARLSGEEERVLRTIEEAFQTKQE